MSFIATNSLSFFDSRGGWNASGTTAGGWGQLSSSVITGTQTAVTTTDGSAINLPTAATTDSDAAVTAATSLRALDSKFYTLIKFQLQTTATVRVFVGLSTSSTTTTYLGADDVAAQRMIGLQYSTSRGDTNFQFMIDDNSTQTVTSTGVAVDTNTHFLSIDCTSGSSVIMNLYDSGGTLQATTGNVTTNLPAGTFAYSVCVGNRTLANSVATIRMYKAEVFSKLI
jgi:hypothetical protein